MGTLQDVLNVRSLDDIGELSTDNLRDAINSLKPQTTGAYTVYFGMTEEETFDARSWISHFSDVRDKAWSRLMCWGSNLVAKDCSCHIRERVLQICGEFCNHVAVCANSLSLFDVDWCVVCDSTGYNLTCDEGSSYRRPDACLAAKVRFYGVMPLIVVDVFCDSPSSRARDSAVHWMSNYRSIQYVISVSVHIGESLAKESTDDISAPIVSQKVELQFPVRCTTNITVWSRVGLGVDMIPLLPEKASLPPPPSSVDYTFMAPREEGMSVSACDYQDNFDFLKQLEDEPDTFSEEIPNSPEGRRCSTVLLSPTCSCATMNPCTMALSPSPTLGLGLNREQFVPRKESTFRLLTKNATLHKGFASCATLATVASESDFTRSAQELPAICAVARLEALTNLTYKFSAGGLLQRTCGETQYRVSRGSCAVTVSEGYPSPGESLSFLSDNSSSDLQYDNPFPVFKTSNLSKEAILHNSNPVEFARCKPSRSESSFMSQTAENSVGGFMLNIPLSNISKALQQLVSLSEKDMDKADVVRFVVNCRRIVTDGVLVGLTRDLKFKYRAQSAGKWQNSVQLILQNLGAAD